MCCFEMDYKYDNKINRGHYGPLSDNYQIFIFLPLPNIPLLSIARYFKNLFHSCNCLPFPFLKGYGLEKGHIVPVLCSHSKKKKKKKKKVLWLTHDLLFGLVVSHVTNLKCSFIILSYSLAFLLLVLSFCLTPLCYPHDHCLTIS